MNLLVNLTWQGCFKDDRVTGEDKVQRFERVKENVVDRERLDSRPVTSGTVVVTLKRVIKHVDGD